MRLAKILGLAFVPGSLLLAACGTSSSEGSAPGTSSQANTSPTIGVAQVSAASSKLGEILVDRQGRTLYLFANDTTSTSTCYTSCVQLWPPLITSGSPTAGPGVEASKLSTTHRTDGTTQVTYAGHPLYSYVSDTKPGAITGQGVNSSGGLWYVVSPTGSAMTG